MDLIIFTTTDNEVFNYFFSIFINFLMYFLPSLAALNILKLIADSIFYK